MGPDHLIFASTSIAQICASLFTATLHHGYMPLVFSDAVVKLIPKGGNKVTSQSENYRETLFWLLAIANSWNIVFLRYLAAV